MRGFPPSELDRRGEDGHNIVESFNNDMDMSTVNFSVPDEVKETFNAAFRKRNKSAIIAELMKEAVEQERRVRRSHKAVLRITARRRSAPITMAKALRDTRQHGRP